MRDMRGLRNGASLNEILSRTNTRSTFVVSSSWCHFVPRRIMNWESLAVLHQECNLRNADFVTNFISLGPPGSGRRREDVMMQFSISNQITSVMAFGLLGKRNFGVNITPIISLYSIVLYILI